MRMSKPLPIRDIVENLDGRINWRVGENVRDFFNEPKEAVALLKSLGFDTTRCVFGGSGENTAVIRSGDKVLKIEGREGSKQIRDGNGFDSFKQIPKALAAEVYHEGTLNGVRYHIAEALTPDAATIEDTVAFLFKSMDSGFIYIDPKPDNFGRDKNGVLKVLDHEHFNLVSAGLDFTHFSGTNHGIRVGRSKSLAVFSDNRSTYVVFSPESDSTERDEKDFAFHKKIEKHLKSCLQDQAGMPPDTVSSQPPAYRIGRTKIAGQDLAEWIKPELPKILHIARSEQLRDDILGLLPPSTLDLPDAKTIAALTKGGFSDAMMEWMEAIETKGVDSNRLDTVEEICNAFFAKQYPKPKNAVPVKDGHQAGIAAAVAAFNKGVSGAGTHISERQASGSQRKR
jgi:hypothetical protein